MIRKWKLLLVGVSCVMGTAMAQNNPILLFPKGCLLYTSDAADE